MKSIIFLLFIVFVSSQIPKYGLINRTRFCKGGRIQNRRCTCPNNTALFNSECKPCVDGSIMFGRCICTQEKYLVGNECKKKKVCSEGYIRLYNNTCIKKCPQNQIRVGNECKRCSHYERKIESRNICIPIPIRDEPPDMDEKPVIYLYPEETMDISVQLNLKNSKFTTIYPKFNDENTWNVRAKPNGDILMNGKAYPYLFWEA